MIVEVRGVVKRFCLVGVDGSGKSTQVELLKKDIKAGYCWLRYSPFLLKPLYLIKNGLKKKSKNDITSNYYSNSMLKKKIFKSKIVSTIWYALTKIDYIQSTKYKIAKIKKNFDLLIFDRYFFDFVVDQGINFNWETDKYIREIKKMAKAFAIPDQTVLLDISPEDALKRKKDIPCIEYLALRCKLYKEIAKAMNWIIIDATLPINKINESIIRIINEL